METLSNQVEFSFNFSTLIQISLLLFSMVKSFLIIFSFLIIVLLSVLLCFKFSLTLPLNLFKVWFLEILKSAFKILVRPSNETCLMKFNFFNFEIDVEMVVVVQPKNSAK